METTQQIWALVIFCVLFSVSICWIFKVKNPIELEALPNESEVLGKDLPVGFRFMEDGNIIEVVKEDGGCSMCYFTNPTREDICKIKCTKSERIDNKNVIFKKM